MVVAQLRAMLQVFRDLLEIFGIELLGAGSDKGSFFGCHTAPSPSNGICSAEIISAVVFTAEHTGEIPVVKQERFEVNVHVLWRRVFTCNESLTTEAEHIGFVGDRVAMRLLRPSRVHKI